MLLLVACTTVTGALERMAFDICSARAKPRIYKGGMLSGLARIELLAQELLGKLGVGAPARLAVTRPTSAFSADSSAAIVRHGFGFVS
jgi:hypothetical protein